MNKRKLVLVLISFLFTSLSYGQLNSAFSNVTGKGAQTILNREYETVGVNPANLGLSDNDWFSLGIGVVNVGVFSNALNYDDIVDFAENDEFEFTDEDKLKYTEKFSINNALEVDANVTLIGLSLNFKRFGGLALTAHERIYQRLNSNSAFADVLFNGNEAGIYNQPAIYNQNVSDVFKGTDFKYMHTREFNIAYGVKLFSLHQDIHIFGGFGFRYISGLSYINLKADGNDWIAQAALPGVMYEINNENIENFEFDEDNMISTKFNGAGVGYGLDFATTIMFFDKFKLGFSVTDIGKIKWDKNVLTSSNNIMKQLDTAYTDGFEDPGMIFNTNGLFDFHPGKSFTTNLPGKFRIGAGIKLSKTFEAGFDIENSLSSNIYSDFDRYYSFGVCLNLARILKIYAGYAGAENSRWTVPVGVTISGYGFFDIYAATNDLFAIVSKPPSPVYSAGFCGIRFNIPNRQKKQTATIPKSENKIEVDKTDTNQQPRKARSE